MKNIIPPNFHQDWQKAVLFVCLLSEGLPPWASGKESWKAIAVLTGWPEKTCRAAFNEAEQRGMIQKEEKRQ